MTPGQILSAWAEWHQGVGREYWPGPRLGCRYGADGLDDLAPDEHELRRIESAKLVDDILARTPDRRAVRDLLMHVYWRGGTTRDYHLRPGEKLPPSVAATGLPAPRCWDTVLTRFRQSVAAGVKGTDTRVGVSSTRV